MPSPAECFADSPHEPKVAPKVAPRTEHCSPTAPPQLGTRRSSPRTPRTRMPRRPSTPPTGPSSARPSSASSRTPARRGSWVRILRLRAGSAPPWHLESIPHQRQSTWNRFHIETDRHPENLESIPLTNRPPSETSRIDSSRGSDGAHPRNREHPPTPPLPIVPTLGWVTATRRAAQDARGRSQAPSIPSL